MISVIQLESFLEKLSKSGPSSWFELVLQLGPFVVQQKLWRQRSDQPLNENSVESRFEATDGSPSAVRTCVCVIERRTTVQSISHASVWSLGRGRRTEREVGNRKETFTSGLRRYLKRVCRKVASAGNLTGVGSQSSVRTKDSEEACHVSANDLTKATGLSLYESKQDA